MPKKHWRGADLVFDLDAPSSTCALGGAPCAPFTCDACLNKVREQMVRLVEEFLLPDFGLTRSELQVSFSGSRGFHVRAYKKEMEPLGRDERREIVDYIEGGGLSFEAFFDSNFKVEQLPLRRTIFERLTGPTPSSSGYAGKFARRVVALAAEPASAVQISPKLKNKERAAKFVEGVKAGDWSKVDLQGERAALASIFESLKVQSARELETDANVTFDTAKILRMPDTIHGGSGLLAKTIPMGVDLGSYEPMQQALAFRMDRVEKVMTSRAIPSISLGGQTFDAMESGKSVELPQAYAVYLVCKKVAVPVA
jgi:DNA primase small subunit